MQSNPINGSDPLGLSAEFDWDAETEDLEAEVTGSRINALGMINESAKWASIGLDMALGIMSGFFPGSGLYDVFQAGANIAGDGGGGFWDFVTIATAAIPAVKMGMAVFKGLRAIMKARVMRMQHMAERGDIALNVLQKLCFVGGTSVLLTDGSFTRIDEMKVGDRVLTQRSRNQTG